MAVALWIALALLAIASILPRAYNSRFVIGGTGWIFLSIYWSLQPGIYFDIQDYVNAFLVIAAAVVSLFIAYIMFKARDKKESGYEVFISLSRAASVGGLLYFLFAEVEFLNIRIISTVTDQAIWVTAKFGVPVVQVAWNQLAVNDMAVEIILTCTAIESIALFSGIISSATGQNNISSDRYDLSSKQYVFICDIFISARFVHNIYWRRPAGLHQQTSFQFLSYFHFWNRSCTDSSVPDFGTCDSLIA